MEWNLTLARRKFITRLATAFGLAGAATAAHAEPVQAAPPATWQGARHPEDAWYDDTPAVHRFVFDTTSPETLDRAMGYADTFLNATKSGYGLKDSDSAVIIIVRHRSTRFGYNDAMWAKYGKHFSQQMDNFVDPKTKEAPIVNIHATAGGTMDKLIQRGARIAICQVATRGTSSSLAKATGGDADTIFNELSANLVTNGRLVPAGIVAVNRAQEHGYAIYIAG